jgi:hypothetical protein
MFAGISKLWVTAELLARATGFDAVAVSPGVMRAFFLYLYSSYPQSSCTSYIRNEDDKVALMTGVAPMTKVALEMTKVANVFPRSAAHPSQWPPQSPPRMKKFNGRYLNDTFIKLNKNKN